MDILGTSLRVCVEDLDAAVTAYERLTGATAVRYAHGSVATAAVGPFLLMSGPPGPMEVLSKIRATLAVRDVEEAARDVRAAGGTVLAGPTPTPAGRSVVARHPDGAIFEYVDRPER